MSDMEMKQGAHLDQMLRQTRAHHVALSTMADMKANILLTMSSVVLTLSIGYISDPNLKWATVILISFCLLTIVLATYAVMPHLPFRVKREPKPDLESPTFNLLFFGDFIRLDYPEFKSAFDAMMSSPRATYDAQVREVYLLGSFLARKKYRYLRLAYVSLIVGFLTSSLVILFTHTA